MTRETGTDDMPLLWTEAASDPRLAAGSKPLCRSTLNNLIRFGKKRPADGQTVKLGFVQAGRSGKATTRSLIARFYRDLNAPGESARGLPSHGEVVASVTRT